jgi:tetratricopeptide (TPR) repeat protein
VKLPATFAWLIVILTASPGRAALTEGPRLAAIYDTILAARFDQAEAAIKQACPPAPAEACATFQVVSVWWRILQDPENRSLDGRINELAKAAISASEAWTKREPMRGEAWFYLAGSYAPLVQWRVLRGERLAAAREGKKIKDALERGLALDPTIADGHFGIGAYHYYADIAPAAAKVLRWLLMLPGGDRVKGLQEMVQARQQGVLLKGEADFQLHVIYLWYEHDTKKAVELLESLDERYPSNPVFLRRLADVDERWLHDWPATAAAWQTLADRARDGLVYDPLVNEMSARLGLAVALDEMYETDRAIDQLKIVAGSVGLPSAVAAQANLRLGLAYDRMGDRDRALPAYTTAIAKAADRPDTASRAREAMRQSPDKTLAESYRLSLEGWRMFEQGSITQARSPLSRAVELNSADPVARYRYARVLDATGDAADARRQLEALLSARVVPAFVLAPALVAYGTLLERAGDRTRAIESYRRAFDVIGGDPRARDQARRALKRLGVA